MAESPMLPNHDMGGSAYNIKHVQTAWYNAYKVRRKLLGGAQGCYCLAKRRVCLEAMRALATRWAGGRMGIGLLETGVLNWKPCALPKLDSVEGIGVDSWGKLIAQLKTLKICSALRRRLA
eukprot:GHVT01082914.1.p1 GENE.GHVT01082914.1~~GHVT01082914.1.p1  ORF type:complete len:137 (+),score=11.03 GHVT01082914.1:51-413(+)